MCKMQNSLGTRLVIHYEGNWPVQRHLNSCLSITSFSEHLLLQILRSIWLTLSAWLAVSLPNQKFVGLEAFLWFEKGGGGV